MVSLRRVFWHTDAQYAVILLGKSQIIQRFTRCATYTPRILLKVSELISAKNVGNWQGNLHTYIFILLPSPRSAASSMGSLRRAFG
jgi:hypothetical protein